MNTLHQFCGKHTAEIMSEAIQNKSRSRIAMGLSIDGGGVKGLTSIAILHYIFRDEPIAEYFDLMAGTSTGGIIVAALAIRDLYTTGEIMELYKNPKDLFRKNLLSLKGIFNAKYKSNHRIFKELFMDKQIQDAKTNLLITAYNYTWDKMKYFKSYRPGYYIYEVLSATSAAPTYFPSIIMPNHEKGERMEELFDGGVGMNDPSFSALTEMNLLRKNGLVSPEKHYNFLLRIGTVSKSSIPRGKAPKGILGTVANLTGMFMGVAESIVSENVMACMEDEKTLVFDIDIPIEKASLKMDEISSKNIDNLIRDTESFIERNQKAINILKTFMALKN